MITSAELRRRITVGMLLQMVRHDWYPQGVLIGKERVVNEVRKTYIALATEKGTSYLYWPKASEMVCREDGFDIILDDKGSIMSYKIVDLRQMKLNLNN